MTSVMDAVAPARPSAFDPAADDAVQDAGVRREPAAAGSARARRRDRKLAFLKWLRLTHLYFGLWGALLGLLFGVTGILLNHRGVLKIPVEKVVQSTVQVAVPAGGFAAPEDLSRWLQSELKFAPKQGPLVRSEPARQVVWGEQEVRQPERWSVSLQGPRRGVNAEYFVGNRFVRLTHNDATVIGLLTRLHMASGADAFWVLLSDTIAGGLIVLSITGLLLWTQLRKVRTVAVLTSLGAVAAAAGFVSLAA